MKTFLIIFSFLFIGEISAQTNSTLFKANEYYQQSQFDLAEIEYRKALRAEPGNTTAMYNLADALQKQKKYDEAIKLLDQLAASTSDLKLKSAVYYNQGVANSKLKNLEASIESYKKSLRLNQSDQQARENLEKALMELKKKLQDQNNKNKEDPKMSQKEAEQKLKLLQQKERELQKRQQQKKQGSGQSEDW